MVGFGPHTGQSGARRSLSSRNFILRLSYVEQPARERRPLAEEDLDRLGRLERADDAAQDPEHARPPGSSARGAAAAAPGRGSGSKGPVATPSFFAAFSGMNVVTCPSKRKMLPCTTGLPMKTLASFTR